MVDVRVVSVASILSGVGFVTGLEIGGRFGDEVGGELTPDIGGDVS